MYNSYHHNNYYNMEAHPEKVARANMEQFVAKLKTYNVLSVMGVIICFIAFPLTGMLNMFGNASFPGFAIVLIPFFGFGIFGGISAYNNYRYRQADALLSIIKQIEGKDKILVENISYRFAKSSSDTLYAIKILMENDNLMYYEIIDDKMVAKKDLNLKSADVYKTKIPESVNMMGEKPKFCPFCGNPMGENEIFCKFCGKRHN